MKAQQFRELHFFRWLCEDEQEEDSKELISLWKDGMYEHLVEVWGMPAYLSPKGENND